jgi:hypothetical protein
MGPKEVTRKLAYSAKQKLKIPLTAAQATSYIQTSVRGGVVKLVITSACHAEGRGFESRLSRHLKFLK